MDTQRRTGILLVAIGAVFLVAQLGGGAFAWPLFILVPGLILLAAPFVGPASAAGLAVPGSIVTTVGLILWVQNATGTFHTWSYAWGLVLAAVGVGTFLQASLERRIEAQREGVRTAAMGLGLFAAFGVFFEFLIFREGMRDAAGWVLPAVLIAGGAVLLWRQRRTG